MVTALQDFFSLRRNMKLSTQNKHICEIWGLSNRVMKVVQLVVFVVQLFFVIKHYILVQYLGEMKWGVSITIAGMLHQIFNAQILTEGQQKGISDIDDESENVDKVGARCWDFSMKRIK